MSFTSEAKKRAIFYSKYSFLREYQNQQAEAFLSDIEKNTEKGALEVHGQQAHIWLKHLGWDSDYFGFPVYKLEFAEWEAELAKPYHDLSLIIKKIQKDLIEKHKKFYLFTEVPSEDTIFLKALGLSGMILIETRHTYFQDQISAVTEKTEKVRKAIEEDIPNLRQTAMQARNDFDRYHADDFYGAKAADEYLAKYTEQCVHGFCDIVLIPDDDNSADAFICGSIDKEKTGNLSIGHLLLAAVNEPRRGWYKKLNTALMCYMKKNNVSVLVNVTQSTNKAVIHVCEQLGYKYGRATHIFSYSVE